MTIAFLWSDCGYASRLLIEDSASSYSHKLAVESLFQSLSQNDTLLEGNLIAIGMYFRSLLDPSTPKDKAEKTYQYLQKEVEKINDGLSRSGADHKIQITKNSAILNPDGSVEFVLEYKENYRPDQVAFKYTPRTDNNEAKLQMFDDKAYITELLSRVKAKADSLKKIDFKYDGHTLFSDELLSYICNHADCEHEERTFLTYYLAGLKNISKDVEKKLEEIFGEKTEKRSSYHLLSSRLGADRHVIAIVKKDRRGNETIKPIFDNMVPAYKLPVSTLITDYQFFKEQAGIPKEQRLILAFGEGWSEVGKDDIALAGGKGASLGEMTKEVPVPPGFIPTSRAYQLFLQTNPVLKEFLREKLFSIDVKNNVLRGQLSRKIATLMKKAAIPEEIKRQVDIYYRHLNILKGDTTYSTPVADRTSGVLEDIAAALSWFKHTTGSQAGQGETYLNVKGIDNVIAKLLDCWVSLFTDRAISYRDDQWFIMLAERLGEKGFLGLTEKLRKGGFNGIAESMASHDSPGDLNLKTAVSKLYEASPNDAKLKDYLKAIEDTSDIFLNPEKLSIAVVIMNMVKSYLSGVAFTVNAGTGFAGKDRAKWLSRHGDNRFVNLDADGNIISTKPMVVQIEFNRGYGETVVGGKVIPVKVVMATLDGENWFILEVSLGTKIYQMVDIEEGFSLLSDQMKEDSVREMAPMVGELVKYAENDVHIARLIKADAELMKRLNNPSADRKENETRIAKLAKEISVFAEKKDKNSIKGLLTENFTGDVEAAVNAILNLVEENRLAAEKGQKALKDSLHIKDKEVAKFKEMILGVWENKDLAEIKDKEDVLKVLKLDMEHFRTLSWLFRSLIDGTFTVIVDMPASLRNSFLLPLEEIHHIAKMVSKIGNSYKDDRDIEFALERDPLGGLGPIFLTDIQGSQLPEKEKLRLYNVQARPYTGKIVDTVVKRDVLKVNPDFITKHNIREVCSGTKGEGAARGPVYTVEDSRNLEQQADEINDTMQKYGWAKVDGTGVISLIAFATPSHDPIMSAAAATITYQGGETSHAAIFCREKGNPCVAGTGTPKGPAAEILQHGKFIVVDANEGKIYEDAEYDGQKIPIDRETIVIKPYLIPFEEGDPKSGMLLASKTMAEILSALTGWWGHYGNSLARMEFGIQEMGIYPQAAVAYDNHKAILRGEIKIDSLDSNERSDVEVLSQAPDIIKAIEDKIKGYPSASEYVMSMMEYLFNTLGFAVAPDQCNIVRDYDNKENEVGDLIGAKLYVHPGENPLIEVRGSSLMIRPASEKPFGLLLEGFLRSIKNGMDNNGWMYVFVRTERELNQLLKQLDKAAGKLGVKVRNVGIMLEVPSDAFIAEELINQLVEYCKRHPGVKAFISFGTNDYTNLAGMTDRDDPEVQALKVLNPYINEITFADGSKYVRDAKGRLIIPLADEGSPVVQRLIETVVAVARRNNVSCGLCGQAIVKMIEYGDYLGAARIMSVLNSYGTDIKNYVMANMVRFDAMSRIKKILEGVSAEKLFDLTGLTQDIGIVSGQIVFVDKPEDLISDELKGLPEVEKAERIKFLRDNDPAKLSRVGNKIVVITKNFGSRSDLEKLGIEYIDLQYARAIIMEEGVDLSEWDLFDKMQERVILSRVKARAKNLSDLRIALDGKDVTIDYENKAVLEGIVETTTHKPTIRELDIPQKEANVTTISASAVLANDIFRRIGIHPLALIAYEKGELDKEGEFKRMVITNIKEEYKQKNVERTEEQIAVEANKYLADLKAMIAAKISGFATPSQYLKEQFKAAMIQAAKSAANEMVVYRIANLTRKDFSQLYGGRIEKINENPAYGLLGAAREVSDFWEVNLLELEALKEARAEGNKNLALLISDLRGVRSGAVLNANMQALRHVGLIPGQDGFEVGVNIVSASDILSIEGYADEGINFVVFEERRSAGSLFGANLDRQKDIGITNKEVKRIVAKPRKMVKEAVKARGLKWVEMREVKTPVLSLLEQAKALVPQAFLDYAMNLTTMALAVKETGSDKMTKPDDNSAMIFSQTVAFGEYKDGEYKEGIGVLLPKLVQSGMKCAVIAVTDKQKALIEELNQGKPENQRIVCAESVDEVKNTIHAGTYYYFKTETEEDINGVTSITIIVRKIIEAIGKVTGIDAKLIEQMHNAAMKFAMAA